jgi:hypothetical protein
MGYDIHITQPKSWSENRAKQISPQDWLAWIENDHELTLSPESGPYFARWSGRSAHPDPWLDWSRGNIYTKNPDEALIDKMVAIARALRVEVQGDDGEIYRGGHETLYYPKPSLLDRALRWLQAMRPVAPLPRIRPPFDVGGRVRDAWRREATVIEIDAEAEHGLGKVKVRYDDGKIVTFTLAASGLDPVKSGENGLLREEQRGSGDKPDSEN